MLFQKLIALPFLQRNLVIFDLLSKVAIALPVMFFGFFIYYVYPTADDYCLANWRNDFGTLGMVKHVYLTWGGRFSAMWLVGIISSAQDYYHGVRLFVLYLFLLTLYGFYQAAQAAFGELSRNRKAWLGLLLLLVYLANSPALNEALYWLSGAVSYGSMAALLGFTLAMVIQAYQGKRSISRIHLALHGLLLFFLIGTHEVNGIVVSVLFVYLAFLDWNTFDKKFFSSQLLLLVISVTATLAVVLAPGNLERANVTSQGRELTFTVLGNSFWQAIVGITQLLSGWTFGALIWLSLVVVFFAFLSEDRIHRFNYRLHLLLSIGLFLLALIATSFLSVVATTALPGTRAQMPIFVAMLICGVWISFLVANWIKTSQPELVPRLGRRLLPVAFALLPLAIHPHDRVQKAFRDMYEIGPRQYQISLSRRVVVGKALREGDRNPVLHALNIPAVPEWLPLYFTQDITSNREDWHNSCYARYYGFDSVQVKWGW